MRKSIAMILFLGLMALALSGQTAKMTAPKLGDSWVRDTTQPITWTWSGSASVKLVLVSQSAGNLGIIKTGLALGAGSFPWKVGTLEDGKSVPAKTDYKVRIVALASNTILDASPIFAIAEPGTPPGGPTAVTFTEVAHVLLTSMASAKAITVSRPSKGETWIPLKTYTVQWTWAVPQTDYANICPGNYKCGAGCPVDLWMVPAANPNSGEKVFLIKECCSHISAGEAGKATYAGEYSGIVPNLQSGDYVVRVGRTDKPGFFGTSQPFTVKSTWSSDSVTLGPDATQGQSDLALTDLFFDDSGNIAIKVKNMGDAYQGHFQIKYKFISIGSSNETLKDEKIVADVSFQPGEEKKMILCHWGGFTFSRKGIPSRFIPENSRPFQATVTISADNDVNANNDWASKRMCMIQEADVGTDGQIRLTFTPKNWIYIASGTANQVPVEGIQWITDKEFTATLEVYIWNYGCAARTFDCLLFVDDLPGQRVASGLFLQPGERVQWQQQVKIKVPSRCGDHKLVFIADPKENGHEPYPNSYQNNFIPVTLQIICGGTINGHGG
jgi:hypothetical protein